VYCRMLDAAESDAKTLLGARAPGAGRGDYRSEHCFLCAQGWRAGRLNSGGDFGRGLRERMSKIKQAVAAEPEPKPVITTLDSPGAESHAVTKGTCNLRQGNPCS